MLTYDYWHSHFQDDRGAVGRTVRLNKHPFTIIGVAPPGFQGPVLFFSTDFFVPFMSQQQAGSASALNARGNPSLLMTIGHLKTRVTPAQASGDLNEIGSYLQRTYPKTAGQMNDIPDGRALGLWGGSFLLSALSAWQPIPKYPLHLTVQPDAHVYAAALLVTLVSTLLFGAVPMRQVLLTDAYQIIKSGSRTTGGRRITFRDLLLVLQIAICAVLITSSFVAVRGLKRSLHSHFGFNPHNAMLLDTDLSMAGYKGDALQAMQKRMIEATLSVPGVQSVGLIDDPLISVDNLRTPIFGDDAVDLRPAKAAAEPETFRISPEYFGAARTAFLLGRPLTWHDNQAAPRVAVINQEFARKIFGSVTNAMGRYFKVQDGTRTEIVGVVENGRYEGIIEELKPAMFLPILQSPVTAATLVVRSNRDPQQLATGMRSKLMDLDAGLPVFIESWDKELDPALFPSRMATLALGVMGAMGAMLSITGIFRMAAYSVSRRLKELGIRMALGAQRTEVLQAALGRALKLLAFGSEAGLVLGILASQVLGSIVSTATPRDPVVLGGSVLAMMLVGLVATWIPAQRAVSLDPMKLLREE